MERGAQLRQHNNQLVVVIYIQSFIIIQDIFMCILLSCFNWNTLLLSFVNLRLRLMQKEFICFKEEWEHERKWILIQFHLNLSHPMVYLCREEILSKQNT